LDGGSANHEGCTYGGEESEIPVFERFKSERILHRAATEVKDNRISVYKFCIDIENHNDMIDLSKVA